MGSFLDKIFTLLVFMSYTAHSCYHRCKCRSDSNIACTERSNSPFIQLPDFLMTTNYKIRQITIKYQNIQVLSVTNRNSLNFVPLVEQLTITHSNVTIIEPHFFNAGLLHFHALDLSRNKIKTIPSGAFYGIQNATVISLAKNQISKIDENFFGTYNLRPWSGDMVIKFNENRLTTFPGKFAERVESFLRSNMPANTKVTIDLSDNPIRCDCAINWFVSSDFSHVQVLGTCSENTGFFEVQGTSLQRLKQDAKFFKDCDKGSFFNFNLLSMQTLLMGIGAVTVLVILLICLYNRISECLYERKMQRYTDSSAQQRYSMTRMKSTGSSNNYNDISLI
ncbi:lumican-like [Convolutriloba macropyga]|uniref:lumican-like n=1 Tax=Convolutriloba macropyga TaxID=536237 RepID=UPI003F51D996